MLAALQADSLRFRLLSIEMSGFPLYEVERISRHLLRGRLAGGTFASVLRSCADKVISIPRPTLLQKWARRQGRRGCSDEGEREGQELTSECVLTTLIRSLAHKHCSFKYAQDRHVHRRP